jgi:YjbR
MAPLGAGPIPRAGRRRVDAAIATMLNSVQIGNSGAPLVNGEDFRRIALSLDGASEAPHFDRAAFRVARTFATLAADQKTANLKFSPDEQAFKSMLAPEAFAPLDNAWGRQGWTLAKLSALNEPELQAALEMAWRHALKTKRRPSGRAR